MTARSKTRNELANRHVVTNRKLLNWREERVLDLPARARPPTFQYPTQSRGGTENDKDYGTKPPSSMERFAKFFAMTGTCKNHPEVLSQSPKHFDGATHK
jgi:hypothetical protein